MVCVLLNLVEHKELKWTEDPGYNYLLPESYCCGLNTSTASHGLARQTDVTMASYNRSRVSSMNRVHLWTSLVSELFPTVGDYRLIDLPPVSYVQFSSRSKIVTYFIEC